jgi:tellurite resistance protein TerC
VFGHHGAAVWLGFTALVVALLVVDLGVLNRRSHVLSLKEAMSWSGGVITIAGLFGLFILWREGGQAALEYYTGYLIELSLSVDNLFVFILIFSYFGVPAEAQPKVLNWGILGAIVMRLLMIALGALLLQRFEWIIYVFGGILVITGVRMMLQTDAPMELDKNPVVRLARRILPFSDGYDGARFLTRTARGKVLATPLLLVLLVIEWSDLVFAIDSIPAIFAVTRDPFLVYSSNVFAIMGLRALFFVLAGMMDRFVYLKPGVALILIFVGTKMTLSHWLHLPITLSLAVILLILSGAVVLSLRRTARREEMPA